MMKSILFFFLISFCGICLGSVSHADTLTLPAHVDFSKVHSAWIQWQNAERANLGLPLYTGNILLQHSAQQWAKTLKDIGKTTHRRSTTDGYYNYRTIRNRFANQGVAFQDEQGTMFSESLGWGYYNCRKDDCTDALITAMRSTFNFFMREKGRTYQPHYKAIVSKNFTDLGLGIAVSGKKYYLVSHYGKNIVATGTKIELAKK